MQGIISRNIVLIPIESLITTVLSSMDTLNTSYYSKCAENYWLVGISGEGKWRWDFPSDLAVLGALQYWQQQSRRSNGLQTQYTD